MSVIVDITIITSVTHRNTNSNFLRSTDPFEIYKFVTNMNVKFRVWRYIMLVNKSLESRTVPKSIKVAKVVSIYNSKAKNQFCNYIYIYIYMSISLLAVLSKVLEKVVHKRLFILGNAQFA